MSKKSEYEKCFTFFNIDQRKYKILGYIMDKSSFIEFKYDLKNFERFKCAQKFNKSDFIYLSIHSSKSAFSTSTFHPIVLKSSQEFKFKFSRNYVQNLCWPYQTNCIESQIIDGKVCGNVIFEKINSKMFQQMSKELLIRTRE
jgi:hypothetical protein